MALARCGALRRAPLIKERLPSARRVLVPYSIEALGRLHDVAAIPAIRGRIATDSRDRALAPGVVALARLRGDKAAKELLSYWVRAAARRDHDALALAFGIAGPDGSEQDLQRIAVDGAGRTPRERAFAWAALGRMASPDESIDQKLRAAFFPFGSSRTVTRLGRFGDSFFLAATDE